MHHCFLFTEAIKRIFAVFEVLVVPKRTLTYVAMRRQSVVESKMIAGTESARLRLRQERVLKSTNGDAPWTRCQQYLQSISTGRIEGL